MLMLSRFFFFGGGDMHNIVTVYSSFKSQEGLHTIGILKRIQGSLIYIKRTCVKCITYKTYTDSCLRCCRFERNVK